MVEDNLVALTITFVKQKFIGTCFVQEQFYQ